MRALRRTLKLALALLASVAVANEPAPPITLTGRLGGSYLLTTDALAATPITSGQFGLNASVAASGGFFNPRLLRWYGSLDYDWARGALFYAPGSYDRFGFRANTLLLGGTPLPISLSASRTFSDSLTQAGTAPLGNTVSTNYSGSVSYRQEHLPTVNVAVSRNLNETTRPGDTPVSSESTRLSLGAAQSLSRFEYGVAYDTSWNAGTYGELNYRAHTLLVNAAAPLTPALRFSVYDNSFLRTPTLSATTNPRYDSNALGAGFIWRASERFTSNLGYAYSHDLVEAPGLSTSERTNHQLTGATRYGLSRGFTLLGSADVTQASVRLDPVRRAGIGERAGAGTEWIGRFDWGGVLLSGLASAGAVQPIDLPSRFVWGVNGTASLTHAWDRLATTLQYVGAYDSGSVILDGASFNQQVRGEGTWRLDPRSRLRALITAGAARRDDALLGTMLSRTLTGLFELTTRNYTAQVGTGTSDGLSEALVNPISDGLFLPAAYNTHSTFFTLAGAAAFDEGRLTLNVSSRLGWLTAPGRPPQNEMGFLLGCAYVIGKFRVSVEERFAVGATGGVPQQTNLLMLRVSRSFDAAF